MSDEPSRVTMSLSVPMAIIIAGALIAAAIYFSIRALGGGPLGAINTQPPVGQIPAGAEPTSIAVDAKNVNTANTPFIGDPNAPVMLAYWSDYQCPFCKRFEEDTFQQIINTYVNTNKVKVVFKDFAFLGSDSTDAAVAGRAVWELSPAKYLEWREAMYLKQDDEGDQGFGDKESIIALTRTISGLDANKVSQLMDQKKDEYLQLINADQVEGKQMGISGTPGFITGTQSISGAQPLAAFTQAIDSQLNK